MTLGTRWTRTPPDFSRMEKTMNLAQLEAFVASEPHVRQMAITRPGAEALLAEIKTLLGLEPEGFQLNTLSSRPVDAFFLLPKLRKFAAEEAEFAKRRGALDAGGAR